MSSLYPFVLLLPLLKPTPHGIDVPQLSWLFCCKRWFEHFLGSEAADSTVIRSINFLGLDVIKKQFRGSI
jgi:hypothetical protein